MRSPYWRGDSDFLQNIRYPTSERARRLFDREAYPQAPRADKDAALERERRLASLRP